MNMPDMPAALVTGAAQGLGRCIAEALHAAGHRVLLTDRDGAAAEAAAAALDPSGQTAWGLALDVTRKADFEAAAAAATERWGGLQVAVNNAAITLTTPVMQISPEEFDEVLRINLRGTFLGCQVFGAMLAQAGYGRLINLASLAGQNGGTASGAHYASSKAGILTLTKIFARELAPRGVTVNAIAPGPMDLPSVRAAVPPERLAKLVEAIPVQRLGNPRFVASLVVQLASREADFATGATWDVNGGIFMR
ncbi:SDR family oxidoreductase [Aquincola tertiaricarbonis]|uniref:SDR family oxidoreductase n=1 Tax=Aquincola tertiaricarbonis TaxID=391953 RepID=A0ABY4S5H5_AQUTE|nr:SDR family oxidoreductase [Aquincola tertiaricarbonis]URI08248.1 SDR family oxidoreductase [Aquincola tertiaricarbonis]